MMSFLFDTLYESLGVFIIELLSCILFLCLVAGETVYEQQNQQFIFVIPLFFYILETK